jgi:hypothetical protein
LRAIRSISTLSSASGRFSKYDLICATEGWTSGFGLSYMSSYGAGDRIVFL